MKPHSVFKDSAEGKHRTSICPTFISLFYRKISNSFEVVYMAKLVRGYDRRFVGGLYDFDDIETEFDDLLKSESSKNDFN